MKREEARRHLWYSISKEEQDISLKRSHSPHKRSQYFPDLTRSTEKSDSSSPTRFTLHLPEISKPVHSKSSRAGISQFFPKKARDPLLTPVSSSQSFTISSHKMSDLEEWFNCEHQTNLSWLIRNTELFGPIFGAYRQHHEALHSRLSEFLS